MSGPQTILPIEDVSERIPRASLFEWICMWIPIVGWIVAGVLDERRRAPVVAAIAEQLLRRPIPDKNIWPASERSTFAMFLADRIQRELGWPNAHFVPDDSFGAFFVDDDGAGTAVIIAVEDYLGIPAGSIDDVQMAEMCRLTFGRAVDYLLALKSQTAGGSGNLSPGSRKDKRV